MKKTLFFLIGLCVFGVAFAQDYPFTCTTEGAKLHYMSLDAKGNENGATIMEIVKVVPSGNDLTITQRSQLFISGNAFTDPVETVTMVRDGNVTIDFGGLSVAAEGAGFVLPRRLEVGLELPTGEVTVYVMGVKTTQDISFHKVVAKEQLTVPAGTYECYVVERKYVARVMGLKVTGSMKIWYARGIGAVRTDNYDKKGKLSSSQVLQEVVLP